MQQGLDPGVVCRSMKHAGPGEQQLIEGGTGDAGSEATPRPRKVPAWGGGQMGCGRGAYAGPAQGDSGQAAGRPVLPFYSGMDCWKTGPTSRGGRDYFYAGWETVMSARNGSVGLLVDMSAWN
jgi:hypothetical protein